MEGLRLAPDENKAQLKEKAIAMLGIAEEDIYRWQIVRKSIDARRNRPPVLVFAVELELLADVEMPLNSPPGVTIRAIPYEPPSAPAFFPSLRAQKPIIVGCGPAGLFAALAFVRNGLPVTLFERGKAVHERTADVAAFWRRGLLDPESHVQFGEGGAGTFSDGKLTSRAKHTLTGWVKQVLVDMGAPVSILLDGKPHIGTDRLREVVVNLREHLIQKGCDVRFQSRMTDIVVHDGHIAGIIVNEKEEIATDCLILASGQSADDTYGMLHARGVHLEPKPFAMGVRVEHPQALIDEIQYGPWAGHPHLPPAEYFLTAKTADGNRSIYTFCMCPGGVVIGSSARAGGIVTNGMSDTLRSGPFANSAVVVNVRVDDFCTGTDSPLAGLTFRKHWEERAFALGGGNYFAPAEKLIHFITDKESPDAGRTTFLPGIRAIPLHEALPHFVALPLKEGLQAFNRKMSGFITAEANLIGIETRTSSPVRITRGPDGQSIGLAGLYPCGEGAGYAGGIISSALDGIRAAKQAIVGC